MCGKNVMWFFLFVARERKLRTCMERKEREGAASDISSSRMTIVERKVAYSIGYRSMPYQVPHPSYQQEMQENHQQPADPPGGSHVWGEQQRQAAAGRPRCHIKAATRHQCDPFRPRGTASVMVKVK